MDAMVICNELRIPYLWVDALCIRQDDETDKAALIQMMDNIYSSAVLTIVAASGGSADAGLPGVSLPRVPQHATRINGVDLLTTGPWFLTSQEECVWNKRGWTFQEKMLSRRLLVFDKTQCFYHCNSTTYYEDAYAESDYVSSHPEDPPYRDDQFDVSAELMEDQYLDLDRHLKYLTKPKSGDGDRLKQYRAAVGGYITRSLSRDDDAVNAFRGILNTLEDDLGPFFWGMPEAEFGVCIAWCWLDDTRGKNDAASFPTTLSSPDYPV
ncbi:hypothetical protein H2201_008242 [Coniosporium apollinis]|uniref:Heterokaryon incompatibility domain-containing protein n=1 Tax=Coniosporium apollinis TaxID=61459 RepID=A0ABQ9NLY2_9PEZI|nr:hypothetical protein H2201_008242 [Coniosporium apollinis]